MPHINKAGSVNRAPLATDELAEPIVCDILVSSKLYLNPKTDNRRKTTTVRTATGIDVLIVRPALSPK